MDPEKRYDCDQMLNHPWMKANLKDSKSLATAKTKLSKYVSIRKQDRDTNSKKNLTKDDDV